MRSLQTEMDDDDVLIENVVIYCGQIASLSVGVDALNGKFSLDLTTLGDCKGFASKTMNVSFSEQTAYTMVFSLGQNDIYLDMVRLDPAMSRKNWRGGCVGVCVGC